MLEKLEIQETISRYHEGASLFDIEAIVSTFLPDGIWEVPSMQVRAEGQADLLETMTALIAPIEYLVQINAPAIIEIDGDSAGARTLVRECALLRDSGIYMDVVGQFVDRLERTPDGWRFAQRTFTIIGSQVTEGKR